MEVIAFRPSVDPKPDVCAERDLGTEMYTELEQG
jgi:hypothetical protein